MPEGKIMPKGHAQRTSEAYAKHMPGSRPENAPNMGILPADLRCRRRPDFWTVNPKVLWEKAFIYTVYRDFEKYFTPINTPNFHNI